MTRTENDTGDLATSVGATATTVAAGRARATRDGLADDSFAEPLVRAVRTPPNRLLADNGLPLQRTGPGAPFAENRYCTAILPEAQRAAR